MAISPFWKSAGKQNSIRLIANTNRSDRSSSRYMLGKEISHAPLRFERHLRKCDGCPSYVEQMRATIRLAGVLDEGDLPPGSREELLAVFRDWKNR